MNKLAITLGLATLASAAFAGNVLHNNGSIVNQGTNLSVITAPNSLFGYGAQSGANNRVADDFTNSVLWNVKELCFTAYQTGSTAFTFTDINWAILSGADINTATAVASGTNAGTNAGDPVIYRVSSAATTATNRGCYNVNVDIADVSLAAGTYWVVWSMGGSLSSGPWVPQVMNGVDPMAGNGQQSINGAAFAPVTWGTATTNTSELPFCVIGDAVPEPATMAALAAGIAAVAARRRRK